MWLLQTGEYIGWEFRDPFLERLKAHFSAMGKMDRITVCDVLDWPGDRPTSGPASNGLGAARDMGFRTNGFIYTTGAETGYCFVNPGFNLLAWETAMAKQYRVRAAYMYRYEEGSKHPQTFMFSRCLWNLNEQPLAALRQYVNWIANTSPDAADKLFEAFVLIDSFTCEGTDGQDHEAKGARIRRLVESALAELPRWRQEELEWLLTTARSLELLGRAVEHRDDRAEMDRLARRLVAVTAASPSFQAYSRRVLDDRGKPGTRFAEHVGWLAKGWYQNVF
jgi:hypothetical protein